MYSSKHVTIAQQLHRPWWLASSRYRPSWHSLELLVVLRVVSLLVRLLREAARALRLCDSEGVTVH